jgi:uncharacterized membrane protein
VLKAGEMIAEQRWAITGVGGEGMFMITHIVVLVVVVCAVISMSEQVT